MLRRNPEAQLAVVLLVVAALALWATSAHPRSLSISPRGLALIEHFEGYFPYPYADPVGVRTVCFGSTGEQIAWAAPFPASREKCRAVLRRSLALRYEPAVRSLGLRLNQHQYDALVSFTYNGGPGLLASLVRGRSLRQIADALLLYDRAGGRVLPGLTRRRQAERALFLEPVPDPLRGFSRLERVLVARYDRLRQRPSLLLRRLRAQARRVQFAARRTGWDKHRRSVRFRELRRRALNR